jgi:hypothetical protein
MVDVTINGHCASDLAVFLHTPNRHRHIMHHAKTFPMIGVGMVKSAADVETNAVL